MKVIIACELQCACGWHMQRSNIYGSNPTVHCPNSECENFGKKFELPIIELTEIQK